MEFLHLSYHTNDRRYADVALNAVAVVLRTKVRVRQLRRRRSCLCAYAVSRVSARALREFLDSQLTDVTTGRVGVDGCARRLVLRVLVESMCTLE
jgi:hypothetical protein